MKEVIFLFLDFDGVLIHEKEMVENQNHGFAPSTMQLLREFVENREKEEIKIVISSSLRLGESLDSLKKQFEPFGLADKVVGMTPFGGFGCIRGDEIRTFLNETDIPYKDFIIFDDNDDMGDYLNRLIETDAGIGITETDIVYANRLIKSLHGLHEMRSYVGGYK